MVMSKEEARNRKKVYNRAYSRKYYAKNREKMFGLTNAWMKKNPERVKAYTQTESFRKVKQKYYAKKLYLRKRSAKKKSPGFVYFFKSIMPGFYKAGCTKNWEHRKKAYQGPSSIDRVYFARPVSDKSYAELVLKRFLAKVGYKPYKPTGRSDWFVLE